MKDTKPKNTNFGFKTIFSRFKTIKFGEEVVKVLNGMAQGLFCSLIIGLIIKQIGTYAHLNFLVEVGQIAQYLTGPAIGVGVANAISSPNLVKYASLVSGAIGANTIIFTTTTTGITYSLQLGEPLGACIAAIFGALCGKLISGKTKVDILLVPLFTIIIGALVGKFVSPAVSLLMKGIGSLINKATTMYPFPMGILVSTIVGMVLTLPISSAAICISLGLNGLAAGAACAGCATQMIGFAVSSYRENKFGGLISQGLGTSMLQIPNIWKNWKIWVPPTFASAIIGPISTCLFKLTNNAAGAGMGTSGLVGQFNAVAVMGSSCLWKIAIVHFLLPALLTLLISELMRKKGWIKENDMLLSS